MIAALFYLVPFSAGAQNKDEAMVKDYAKGFYIGLKGGAAIGSSTFCTFGEEHSSLRPSFGLLAGYRFSPVWSLEVSAQLGKMVMNRQKYYQDYWLGADGNRYVAPVLGMDCYNYKDIRSEVSLGQFALQVNVDLLPLLFSDTKGWSVSVSPALSLLTTNAKIRTAEDKKEVYNPAGSTHFGVGGDLNVGYQLTRQLGLRLSSGLVHAFGDRIDGMPEYLFKRNLIWNNSLAVTWSFGKKKTKAARKESTILPANSEVAPVAVVKDEEPTREEKPVVKEEEKELFFPEEEQTDAKVEAMKDEIVATVYFDFNSIYPNRSEQRKLRELIKTLKANPELNVHINGWSDAKGSEKSNLNVSRQRAESVRRELTKAGINPERISTEGCGVAPEARQDAQAARRADVINLSKKGGNQ